MTKEQIKKWVKEYIEDVKDAIHEFNDENGRLFGFNDVVEVYLETKINWTKVEAKQEDVYEYEVAVNWSSVGNMSVEDTKKFAQAIDNAIRFAEELNTDLQNNLQDNSRDKIYKYGMRMRPAGLGCQPNGFIKIGDEQPYWNVLYYNRKLTEEEIRNYELDYLGEAEE